MVRERVARLLAHKDADTGPSELLAGFRRPAQTASPPLLGALAGEE